MYKITFFYDNNKIDIVSTYTETTQHFWDRVQNKYSLMTVPFSVEWDKQTVYEILCSRYYHKECLNYGKENDLFYIKKECF